MGHRERYDLQVEPRDGRLRVSVREEGKLLRFPIDGRTWIDRDDVPSAVRAGLELICGDPPTRTLRKSVRDELSLSVTAPPHLHRLLVGYLAAFERLDDAWVSEALDGMLRPEEVPEGPALAALRECEALWRGASEGAPEELAGLQALRQILERGASGFKSPSASIAVTATSHEDLRDVFFALVGAARGEMSQFPVSPPAILELTPSRSSPRPFTVELFPPEQLEELVRHVAESPREHPAGTSDLLTRLARGQHPVPASWSDLVALGGAAIAIRRVGVAWPGATVGSAQTVFVFAHSCPSEVRRAEADRCLRAAAVHLRTSKGPSDLSRRPRAGETALLGDLRIADSVDTPEHADVRTLAAVYDLLDRPWGSSATPPEILMPLCSALHRRAGTSTGRDPSPGGLKVLFSAAAGGSVPTREALVALVEWALHRDRVVQAHRDAIDQVDRTGWNEVDRVRQSLRSVRDRARDALEARTSAAAQPALRSEHSAAIQALTKILSRVVERRATIREALTQRTEERKASLQSGTLGHQLADVLASSRRPTARDVLRAQAGGSDSSSRSQRLNALAIEVDGPIDEAAMRWLRHTVRQEVENLLRAFAGPLGAGPDDSLTSDLDRIVRQVMSADLPKRHADEGTERHHFVEHEANIEKVISSRRTERIREMTRWTVGAANAIFDEASLQTADRAEAHLAHRKAECEQELARLQTDQRSQAVCEAARDDLRRRHEALHAALRCLDRALEAVG
jgi:hypothetical protein